MDRWLTILAAATLVLLLSATEAAGQTCVGVPTATGQNGLDGSIGFPSGSTIFGAGLHHNMRDNPFALSARYERTNFDGPGGVNTFGGGATYDLGTLDPVSDALDFCANARLNYTSMNGGSTLHVPLGIGFGASFMVGEDPERGFNLIPFGVPAIHHTRFSNGASSSSTDLDVTVGITGLFGRFYGTFDLQNILRDGDAVPTLRFGALF